MGPGPYANEERIIPDSLPYPHFMRETLEGGGCDPFLSLSNAFSGSSGWNLSEANGLVSTPVIESVRVRVHPCAGLLNFLEALYPTPAHTTLFSSTPLPTLVLRFGFREELASGSWVCSGARLLAPALFSEILSPRPQRRLGR